MSKRFNNHPNRQKQYVRKCLAEMYKKKGEAPEYLYVNRVVKAPFNFSLINNPKETIEYFNRIIHYVLSIKDFIRIHLDLSEVKETTIDAIMYMIAVSRNIDNGFKPRFSIYLPKDKDLKEFILSSGIADYFNANELKINLNNDYFSIKMGDNTNVQIAKDLCDFTNNHLNTQMIFTQFLYDMLIEMMTNTGQHAYNKGERIKNQWFIFAENSGSCIRYTFIDTGEGIPKTMSKYMIKISENEIEKDGHLKAILDSFTEENNLDGNLIITGLTKGGFRTRTNKSYRGKGLPEIYNHFKDDKKTSSLKIISGACLCEFDEKNREKAIITNLNDKFVGTLFYWEIEKNGGVKDAL